MSTDDKEEEKDGAVSHSSSIESGMLHPDHCYLGVGSRRGSSQSEIIEADTYQLGIEFSRSLPGSRRSSFQNTATAEKGGLIVLKLLTFIYRSYFSLLEISYYNEFC